MDVFEGRLGLLQRVLPAYRAPFFDALAAACTEGLEVLAGQPRAEEAIADVTALQVAHLTHVHNRHCFGGRLYLCYQEGLIHWLAAWHPRALIVEANPRYVSTAQAVSWMHTRGRPVLGWGLGAPSTGRALALVRRRFLAQFDALITYSQQGAAEYRSAGFPSERIFVAPNAATARPATPPAPRPLHFIERPTVLFVGRIQERKRLDLLLQACAALPLELQPRVWIVGDGPARAALEALAGRIYPAAEFVGALHGLDLEPYFSGADLFVLPGTGGLAVQQAMAHGLPVIVAEADGTQADLVRPQNGWQVPAGDGMALKETLQQALSDVTRLRQMGVASYRIVADEINLENMVAVFLRALHRVAR